MKSTQSSSNAKQFREAGNLFNMIRLNGTRIRKPDGKNKKYSNNRQLRLNGYT